MKTNILDVVGALLGTPLYKGILPDSPDDCLALFEYAAQPPTPLFSGTREYYGVQVRARSASPARAYAAARAAYGSLHRYTDGRLSCLSASSILDLGQDAQKRQEYVVNFLIRRYGR